jgi:hypothetical protein
MKKINKFKGIRLDNKEWAFGSFIYDEIHPCIVPHLGLSHDIVVNTECQFTNIFDALRNEIYENDIIENENWNPKRYRVIFEDGEFCFVGIDDEDITYTNPIHYAKQFVKVGNILEQK